MIKKNYLHNLIERILQSKLFAILAKVLIIKEITLPKNPTKVALIRC